MCVDELAQKLVWIPKRDIRYVVVTDCISEVKFIKGWNICSPIFKRRNDKLVMGPKVRRGGGSFANHDKLFC